MEAKICIRENLYCTVDMLRTGIVDIIISLRATKYSVKLSGVPSGCFIQGLLVFLFLVTYVPFMDIFFRNY